jgi:uncharacterized protein YbjQ (UPF0145 family)
MGNKEPSALGILLYLLFLSAVFAIGLANTEPLIALALVAIWPIIFIVIIAHDHTNWGQPKLNTLGIRLSTKTRKLGSDNYSVEGMVMGSCVKARNIFSTARAEARSLVGGEAKQLTSLVNECRNVALTRMCQQAIDKGCNGIVGYRMITAETLWGATEIIAYGTAVRIK